MLEQLRLGVNQLVGDNCHLLAVWRKDSEHKRVCRARGCQLGQSVRKLYQLQRSAVHCLDAQVVVLAKGHHKVGVFIFTFLVLLDRQEVVVKDV